jgi:hypothetical protein
MLHVKKPVLAEPGRLVTKQLLHTVHAWCISGSVMMNKRVDIYILNLSKFGNFREIARSVSRSSQTLSWASNKSVCESTPEAQC